MMHRAYCEPLLYLAIKKNWIAGVNPFVYVMSCIFLNLGEGRGHLLFSSLRGLGWNGARKYVAVLLVSEWPRTVRALRGPPVTHTPTASPRMLGYGVASGTHFQLQEAVSRGPKGRRREPVPCGDAQHSLFTYEFTGQSQHLSIRRKGARDGLGGGSTGTRGQ